MQPAMFRLKLNHISAAKFGSVHRTIPTFLTQPPPAEQASFGVSLTGIVLNYSSQTQEAGRREFSKSSSNLRPFYRMSTFARQNVCAAEHVIAHFRTLTKTLKPCGFGGHALSLTLKIPEKMRHCGGNPHEW
jgi:hypothetical protein